MSQSTTKVLLAPSKYVLGRGTIFHIGEHIENYGKKWFVMGGKRGLDVTREGRTKSFNEKGMTQVEDVFRGESSQVEVDRLVANAKGKGFDGVIASGGGKSLDTAKIVADYLNIATIIIPTTASTDAPTSRLGLLYSEDHIFEKFYFPKRNPDVVLMDCDIIAQAPVRTLVAGMGDALATYFEADANDRTLSVTCAGGVQTATGLALARLCFDLLMEYGLQAKIACENKLVTPALEKVIEANSLLSGLGWESGGLAAAHAMQDGFTVLPPIHEFLHGEKVGFLTLVQLIMENRPKEVLQQIYDFSYKIGLPITLADLNCENVTPDQLKEAVHISCAEGESIFNHAFMITEEFVYDCILAADAFGKRVKAGLPIV